MSKPNEAAAATKATPLVEQIAQQFETRLENQGYLGITDKTPPEVAARIRRHVTNEFRAAFEKVAGSDRTYICPHCREEQDSAEIHVCPKKVSSSESPKEERGEPQAFTFEDHVAMMDAKHPDWLKGNNHGATSLMAVAKEFWEASAASRQLGSEPQWECPDCHTRYIEDIGKCGDLTGCSRPNVIPVVTIEPPKEERGEPQKQWIGSIGGLITASHKSIAVALDIDNAKAIADAHNAALAAERADYDKLHDKAVHWQDEALAEREKREQAEHSAKAWEYDSRAGKEIQKGLHAELLAALAAIEGHNNDPEMVAKCGKFTLDLSALREHDEKLIAEVRKPLVDLLGECRCKLDWSVTDGKFLAKIDAALAQIKE